MECTVAHFFLGFLIIIIIKESLAGAARVTLLLEASPATLESSGDTVTVSWKGLESPTELDWLGIFTPPESSDDHFIGYVLLSSVSAGWQTGYGSYAFPAVNMRAPYEFRLFRGAAPAEGAPVDEDLKPLPSTAARLAVSPAVGFANYNEPTQVHLALTADPSEMSVVFVTRDPVGGGAKYGKAADELFSAAAADWRTYQQKDMCDAPANTMLGWRDPGYIHTAVMGALEPGARYFYQVGSAESGWSKTYSFMAPRPSDGGAPAETDALLFGDMGTYVPYTTRNWVQAESVNTLKWLRRDLDQLGDRPALVSHIGDISYARGYAWLWDNFFTQIEPVAARAPWHVCIGNHEYDWPAQPWRPSWAPYGMDSGGECGVPYSRRFAMPGTASQDTRDTVPGTRNLYYSLDVGAVHFVYMSTETDFLPGGDQYDWIARDLAATDRRRTPFVVFQGHRPMYSTDNKAMAAPITRRMIEHLEPLLVAHRVSLALWGHVHKYERTCPLQNGTCMGSSPSDGMVFPVHMVIGMGGQDWQPTDEPRPDRPTAPIFPQPPWSLYRSFEFGYVRLHASRDLMTVSYVGNHDGQVHDVVEFLSPFPPAPIQHFEGHHVLDEKIKRRSNSVFNRLHHALRSGAAFILGAGITGILIQSYSQRPGAESARGSWAPLRGR